MVGLKRGRRWALNLTRAISRDFCPNRGGGALWQFPKNGSLGNRLVHGNHLVGRKKTAAW